MKRIILGALLGAVVFFIWGAISWMVLPWHNATLKNLPNEGETIIQLKHAVPESGVYYFPAMPHGNYTEEQLKVAEQAFAEKHKQGPVGMLVYNREGMEPMEGSVFGRGFLLDFIAALLVALVLSKTTLSGYFCRVRVAAAMGLFAGIVSYFSLWNWMHFPTSYCVVMVADLIVGWGLAGLAIAAIVKPTACCAK